MNYIFTQSTFFNDVYETYNYDFCFYNSLIDLGCKDKIVIFTNKPFFYEKYKKYLNVEIIEKNISDVVFPDIDFLARHVWVNQYIEKNKLDDEFICFLDSRDSFFQTSIFDKIKETDKLNFYEEEILFINDWSLPQLERYKNHKDYEKIKTYNGHMINGGSLLGKAKLYKKFIEFSISKTNELNNISTSIPLGDQVFFNKLLVCNLESLDYVYKNPPYSLLTSGVNPIYFKDNKFIKDGKLLNWIHQYDRHDDVKKCITEYYKDRYTF